MHHRVRAEVDELHALRDGGVVRGADQRGTLISGHQRELVVQALGVHVDVRLEAGLLEDLLRDHALGGVLRAEAERDIAEATDVDDLLAVFVRDGFRRQWIRARDGEHDLDIGEEFIVQAVVLFVAHQDDTEVDCAVLDELLRLQALHDVELQLDGRVLTVKLLI